MYDSDIGHITSIYFSLYAQFFIFLITTTKKKVFNLVLNCSKDLHTLKWFGSEFT